MVTPYAFPPAPATARGPGGAQNSLGMMLGLKQNPPYAVVPVPAGLALIGRDT